MSFKRYASGAWTDIENVKRYSGGAWADCESVKKYSGGAWTPVWEKKKGVVYGWVFSPESNYLPDYEYEPRNETNAFVKVISKNISSINIAELVLSYNCNIPAGTSCSFSYGMTNNKYSGGSPLFLLFQYDGTDLKEVGRKSTAEASGSFSWTTPSDKVITRLNFVLRITGSSGSYNEGLLNTMRFQGGESLKFH